MLVGTSDIFFKFFHLCREKNFFPKGSEIKTRYFLFLYVILSFLC